MSAEDALADGVSAYDVAFDRVLASAAVEVSRVEAERRAAVEFADELEVELRQRRTEDVALEIGRQARYRTWALSEVLRTRSFDGGRAPTAGAVV